MFTADVYGWWLRLVAITPERGYTSPGMNFMRSFRVIPPALRRPAMLFFVIAQVLLALAPLIEGRFGADSRSHVESAGTRSHHAHDGADCTACAARGLLATPGHAAQSAIGSSLSSLLPLAARTENLDSQRESGSRPRAPPFRQA